ncbi:glycosyl hydrolase family 17 protein [Gammaproteobacteria bacterium]|nr:glycosyl hydrolase family 17 protein [Gammaproteobacteria bacterium]
MKKLFFISLFLITSCNKSGVLDMNKSAKEFIGNINYPAISYGGYRGESREIQPSIDHIKEDLQIMFAQGFRVIRTYDLHHPFAENTLKAIRELKNLNSDFEMYVMLGTWIQCKDAFTEQPIHVEEDIEANNAEIAEAVRLAQEYPDIVKIIAVGNESMVHWAVSYFVKPSVILKWVNHLQNLKEIGKLSPDLWITSSDNFASWGGGDHAYHNDDLNELIRAVDFISMHTYAFHDTYYNSSFWNLESDNIGKDKIEIINNAMVKSVEYEFQQYLSVKKYIQEIDDSKDVHIGETGWSSIASDLYGTDGTQAADEYKQGIYYKMITDLCKSLSISCFYFSAFDEPWKDSSNPNGSENHFGLFTVDGKAKYAMWESFDQNKFDGLTRPNQVSKTFDGDLNLLMKTVHLPPMNGINE